MGRMCDGEEAEEIVDDDDEDHQLLLNSVSSELANTSF